MLAQKDPLGSVSLHGTKPDLPPVEVHILDIDTQCGRKADARGKHEMKKKMVSSTRSALGFCQDIQKALLFLEVQSLRGRRTADCAPDHTPRILGSEACQMQVREKALQRGSDRIHR